MRVGILHASTTNVLDVDNAGPNPNKEPSFVPSKPLNACLHCAYRAFGLPEYIPVTVRQHVRLRIVIARDAEPNSLQLGMAWKSCERIKALTRFNSAPAAG